MSTSFRNAFVTGAAGFIGYHLCHRLLREGIHVTGYDNCDDYYDPRLKESRLSNLRDAATSASFRFHREDIVDRDSLQRSIEEADPEIIIHLAAQAGVRHSFDAPGDYIESNIVGVFNLLETAKNISKERGRLRHIVAASSSSVYGGERALPYREDSAADRPINIYAASKRSGELIAHSYARLWELPITMLRFFTVYGPWGRPDMALFIFTKALLTGKKIQLYNGGDMIRDFTYIDDIIEGMARLMVLPPSTDNYRVVNIGGNCPIRVTDMVSQLEQKLGKKGNYEHLPMQRGEAYATRADVRRLEKLVGFRPATPFQQGVSQFVNWYKDYYGHNN